MIEKQCWRSTPFGRCFGIWIAAYADTFVRRSSEAVLMESCSRQVKKSKGSISPSWLLSQPFWHLCSTPHQVITRVIFQGFTQLSGLQQITISTRAPSRSQTVNNGLHGSTGYLERSVDYASEALCEWHGLSFLFLFPSC